MNEMVFCHFDEYCNALHQNGKSADNSEKVLYRPIFKMKLPNKKINGLTVKK